MHNAAQIGQIPMAELLLAHGAEVSPLSTDQRTPLDFAREQNHNDMVTYLIKQGAKG
jgi:ankyrin repeat protein